MNADRFRNVLKILILDVEKVLIDSHRLKLRISFLKIVAYERCTIRRTFSFKCIIFFIKLTDTSRPPRPGEVNGKEYHFVSCEKMEEEIQAGKFIEFGEYKGNLYGTSAEGVSSLVNAGYVCLLNPHYQALKMLRTPQSKPYVIYIKPPRFEILKETRNEARARSTYDETNSRGFTVRHLSLPESPEFIPFSIQDSEELCLLNN